MGKMGSNLNKGQKKFLERMNRFLAQVSKTGADLNDSLVAVGKKTGMSAWSVKSYIERLVAAKRVTKGPNGKLSLSLTTPVTESEFSDVLSSFGLACGYRKKQQGTKKGSVGTAVEKKADKSIERILSAPIMFSSHDGGASASDASGDDSVTIVASPVALAKLIKLLCA